MENVTLQLGELTCPSCMQKIENAVGKLNGVNSVKVLFNASKVKAEIDPSVIAPDQVKSTIHNLGYDVLGMNVKELA